MRIGHFIKRYLAGVCPFVIQARLLDFVVLAHRQSNFSNKLSSKRSNNPLEQKVAGQSLWILLIRA